ncbi:MAG: MFS transporter [Verrucomicrobiota bacterium]
MARSKLGPIYLTLVVGTLAVSIDFASIDLALPALERAFGFDLEAIQWVINGYMIAFAVLMVTGGRLADAYGRRRFFLIGLTVFGGASLAGGLSPSGEVLIALRVIQGIGAAVMWPAMLGMGCGAVGPVKSAQVLGIVMATASIGNAAGPVVGGALTEYFSWRWVLWINVPMALLTFAVTWFFVEDDRPDKGATKPRNDYAGILCLTTGLVSLMIAVYQGDNWGWVTGKTLGLGIFGILLIFFFPFVEKRVPEPLVPQSLLYSREILTICVSSLTICGLFLIVLLYFTQYGMKFVGDSPTVAGGRVVLFMISYGTAAYITGLVYPKIGARRLMFFGFIFCVGASVFLGWVGAGASLVPLNLGLIFLGIGVGTSLPAGTSRAVQTAGVEQASLASGIVFLVQLAGAALLMAIGTALFYVISGFSMDAALSAKNQTLTASEQQIVTGILSGAENVKQIPEKTLDKLPELVGMMQGAYSNGLRWVLWFLAAVSAIVLVLIAAFIPRKLPVEEKPEESDPSNEVQVK